MSNILIIKKFNSYMRAQIIYVNLNLRKNSQNYKFKFFFKTKFELCSS